MKQETYLEIEDLDADHRASLAEKLGRPVDADDSLTCEASFDVDGADPSVGIMTATIDVYSVTFTEDGTTFDLTDFFDLDLIAAQIEETEADNPDDEYDRCRNEER